MDRKVRTPADALRDPRPGDVSDTAPQPPPKQRVLTFPNRDIRPAARPWRDLWRRINDWWNPPCPKHPGHRQREIDTEIATGCAMCPYPALMCAECFKEAEEDVCY